MKKHYLLFTLFNLFISIINAQISVPLSDIYDFNIGDEFHYEYRREIRNQITSTTTLNEKKLINRTVINKTVSSGNITYTFLDSIDKRRQFDSPPFSSASIFVDTINFEVEFIDTLKDTITCSSSSFDYDSACTSMNGDTICVYGNDSINLEVPVGCFDTSYKHTYFDGICSVSGSKSIENYYTKGIGLISSYHIMHDGSGETIRINKNLIFHKKIGEAACGSPKYLNINKLTKQIEFNVYPNPSNGNINIEGKFSPNATITIKDIQGKSIYQKPLIKELTLDIRPGLYIAIISDNDKTGVRRIVIR